MKAPKNIVAIGLKFLVTLVNVSEIYLTTQNYKVVAADAYIHLINKFILLPSGIPEYKALYNCLFTINKIATDAKRARINNNYSG